jgi:hypothetical protein
VKGDEQRRALRQMPRDVDQLARDLLMSGRSEARARGVRGGSAADAPHPATRL